MSSSHPPLVRAFQWDLARQVERLEVLLDLLPRYAAWGYQELYLHLEDAVEYPSLPNVARSDAYSGREFGRLVERAQSVGIKVVPIVNLLGHTQYLIKVPELRDLNELRTENDSPLERGQICPLHARTLEVADKLLGDVVPFCTAGKVHVGLDESFQLGKCPRCREEIARIGLAAHFAHYVQRLHELTHARGLRLGLWADMLNYIPDAISLLPTDVIAYDWYYYPFRRHPRVELYGFAESDLATPLRARGIEYWGCPMNGAFRYEPLPLFRDRLANLRSWWDRCQRVGASGFLVTSWEADRLALEMPTVVDAAAASFWQNPAATVNDLDFLTDGFSRLYSPKGARALARQALAGDAYPYSGYYHWRTNDRWDITCSDTELNPARQAEHHFGQIERRLRRAPTALSASVTFRHYLAKRDRFIAESQQAVFSVRQLLKARRLKLAEKQIDRLTDRAAEFRQALKVGKQAARTMWRCSRAAGADSQNQKILDQDSARLKDWQRWLRRAQDNLAIVVDDTPVCGAWQLEFEVSNFAPALQKIVVEQRDRSAQWTTRHALFLIEFTAEGAKPRADLTRRWSLPVAWSGPAAQDTAELILRVGLRGLGQVKVSNFALFNGVTRVALKPSSSKKKLGSPAPKIGFPQPDWAQNTDEVLLFLPGKRKPPLV